MSQKKLLLLAAAVTAAATVVLMYFVMRPDLPLDHRGAFGVYLDDLHLETASGANTEIVPGTVLRYDPTSASFSVRAPRSVAFTDPGKIAPTPYALLETGTFVDELNFRSDAEVKLPQLTANVSATGATHVVTVATKVSSSTMTEDQFHAAGLKPEFASPAAGEVYVVVAQTVVSDKLHYEFCKKVTWLLGTRFSKVSVSNGGSIGSQAELEFKSQLLGFQRVKVLAGGPASPLTDGDASDLVKDLRASGVTASASGNQVVADVPPQQLPFVAALASARTEHVVTTATLRTDLKTRTEELAKASTAAASLRDDLAASNDKFSRVSAAFEEAKTAAVRITAERAAERDELTRSRLDQESRNKRLFALNTKLESELRESFASASKRTERVVDEKVSDADLDELVRNATRASDPSTFRELMQLVRARARMEGAKAAR